MAAARYTDCAHARVADLRAMALKLDPAARRWKKEELCRQLRIPGPAERYRRSPRAPAGGGRAEAARRPRAPPTRTTVAQLKRLAALEDMTVAQLKRLADSLGVGYTSRTRKAELVGALARHAVATEAAAVVPVGPPRPPVAPVPPPSSRARSQARPRPVASPVLAERARPVPPIPGLSLGLWELALSHGVRIPSGATARDVRALVRQRMLPPVLAELVNRIAREISGGRDPSRVLAALRDALADLPEAERKEVGPLFGASSNAATSELVELLLRHARDLAEARGLSP